MNKLDYVLITPAHDEEAYIEKTIHSVIHQTILPKKWVIVSDGSIDQTDTIVKRYAQDKSWLDLVRMPDRKDRHFAAKVQAFNMGYERVKDLEYDIIGNLDADVSFGEDYFEYLLDQFESDPALGVAGTHYIEGGFHSFRDSYIDVHHVNGQCQLFRRRCFEEIGGYVPIKEGGIDWVAVTTARMKGWKTYSFSERTFVHHRKMGTAKTSILESRFHYGKKDYFCGGHPLWQIFRAIFQMTKKPYLTGGTCLLLGYAWAWATGAVRPVSEELIKFHRQEQMQRLRNLMVDKFGRERKKSDGRSGEADIKARAVKIKLK